MDFPLYRKYSNALSLFKIESETEFIELKKMAKSWEEYRFTATIFPDRQLISDMIEKRHDHWVDSNEEEFLQVQAKAQRV